MFFPYESNSTFTGKSRKRPAPRQHETLAPVGGSKTGTVDGFGDGRSTYSRTLRPGTRKTTGAPLKKATYCTWLPMTHKAKARNNLTSVPHAHTKCRPGATPAWNKWQKRQLCRAATIGAQIAEGFGTTAERVTTHQTSGNPFNDSSKRDTELSAVGGAAVSAAEKATKHALKTTAAIDFPPKVAPDKRQTLTWKT